MTALCIGGILGLNLILLWQVTLLRKAIPMSANLDALTAAVGKLETESAAAISEVNAALAASDTAALPALTTRIETVAANLAAVVPAPAAS
jgi:HPt (histidine-containing phosphotransfer) domain-containing protein